MRVKVGKDSTGSFFMSKAFDVQPQTYEDFETESEQTTLKELKFPVYKSLHNFSTASLDSPECKDNTAVIYTSLDGSGTVLKECTVIKKAMNYEGILHGSADQDSIKVIINSLEDLEKLSVNACKQNNSSIPY
jgi:hypothetical protein